MHYESTPKSMKQLAFEGIQITPTKHKTGKHHPKNTCFLSARGYDPGAATQLGVPVAKKIREKGSSLVKTYRQFLAARKKGKFTVEQAAKGWHKMEKFF